MRKIIAGINMTIDGICDHTAVTPDAEVHDHYTDLISQADCILYGRTTYELMQFWRDLVQNPSGQKSMDDFAKSIDRIPKLVFSNTIKITDWHSAKLAEKSIKEEVIALKQIPGKDVLVGSRSLIIQLIELNLLDELQLCIHPVIAGRGLPLFENLNERKLLKLKNTKCFESGAIVLYYELLKEN